jgi:hypothetical protein
MTINTNLYNMGIDKLRALYTETDNATVKDEAWLDYRMELRKTIKVLDNNGAR